jgi:hypothetical protein
MPVTTFEGAVVVAVVAAALPFGGALAQRRWTRSDSARDQQAADQAKRELRKVDLNRSTAASLIDECSEIRAHVLSIPQNKDVTEEYLREAFLGLDRLRPRLADKATRQLVDDCSCILWYAVYLSAAGEGRSLASSIADYVTDIATALLTESAEPPPEPDWYASYLAAYRAIKTPPPNEPDASEPTPATAT